MSRVRLKGRERQDASAVGRSVETRIPLSRDRVLRAATDLADAAGIDALTMRRLAQELGVEAMTLYYHVTNKEDILEGITDIVVGEIELPASEPDWKASLRRTAISAHEILARHPWAANLMLSGGVRQSRLRYMEAVLGCLRRGGFSAEMAHHAYHALDSHIVGFTLWHVGMAIDAQKLPDLAATFLRDLSRDEFPYLAEHIQQHLTKSREYTGSEFDFGLDLILDGLDRFRDGTGAVTTPRASRSRAAERSAHRSRRRARPTA
jgi:AcrR family transcriptional regulator